jgi:hypothetical protein
MFRIQIQMILAVEMSLTDWFIWYVLSGVCWFFLLAKTVYELIYNLMGHVVGKYVGVYVVGVNCKSLSKYR